MWVKVNAPADRKIARLVEALSRFSKLRTIESCQGSKKTGAWVCFAYGEDQSWKDLSEFVCGYFAPKLAHLVNEAANVSIQITESGRIQGELSVRPGMIDTVTTAVEKLARVYRAYDLP